MRQVKCTDWDGKSDWLYAHLKRDGEWITLFTDANRKVHLWTRTPRNITDKMMWHPSVRIFADNAPPQTTFFCELFVEGGSRNDVKGAIRDEHHALRLHAFAIEKFDGGEVPARKDLHSVKMLVEWTGMTFVPYFEQGHDISLDNLPPDVEGYVLKDGNLHNWRKVKPEKTYDLRIIGFTLGTPGSEFDGLIGSIILADAMGNEVARASGMTREVRQHMTDNKLEYAGRICEVAAQGLGSAGGLCHPRFIRMRDDKTEADTL